MGTNLNTAMIAVVDVVSYEVWAELTGTTHPGARCAFAAARGGTVATDDRKALRLLAAGNPPIPTYRTTQSLSSWAKLEEISELELRGVLLAVSERACYGPAKVDPLRSWWLRIVGEG